MIVVVADTSPINYLVLIDQTGILQRLYQRVVIPEEVLAELMDDSAPPVVREWMMRRPGWIEIRSAPGRDEDLTGLDAGEAAAI